MASGPKKGSQFAGAAALFRQKESELQKQQSLMDISEPSPSGRRRDSQFSGAAAMFQERANASMSNVNLSPVKFSKKKNASLAPPPFVSPGGRGAGALKANKMPSASQFPSSSYLDKSTITPTQAPKKRATVAGFGDSALPMSPSPVGGGRPSVSQSWKDKGGISFQAASPSTVKKPSVPSFSSYPGGSYTSSSKKKKEHEVTKMQETPDIKIEVKIPDIDAKIRARKAAARAPKDDSDNVPEHIRKFREREAARKKAMDEQAYRAATIMQKYFLGWKARAAYPALLKANEGRLKKMREEEARKKQRIKAAITIQKTFRMYGPRQEFLRKMEIKRRREKNKKEIKRIKKKIANMPKKTKDDIKELKKEYADKKKKVKKEIKKKLKEEEAEMEDLRKNGHTHIEILKKENDKIREQITAVDSETMILEKQFDVLMAKADELRRNFQSLQSWVTKKNQSIQNNEIASQKCRHRYLPKYRAEMATRNKHCIAEVRVKKLYKARLEQIVQEILKRSSDPDLVEEAHEALVSCEEELKEMPEVPVPEGLQGWLM